LKHETEISLFLFINKQGKLINEVFTKRGKKYLISRKEVNKIIDPFASWKAFYFD